MSQKFNSNMQDFLEATDQFCRDTIEQYKTLKTRESLGGDEVQMDENDTALMNLIVAFGILYNRAIEEGWVSGVVLSNEKE